MSSSRLVPLLEVARLLRGTEPGAKAYSKRGGIRFLRVSDLTGTRQAPVYVPDSKKLVVVRSNDVLLTLDGTPGIVAKGFSGAISSGIRKIEPIQPETFLRDYIYYALQTRTVQETIRKFTKGVTIRHASSSLEHIRIPEPPLEAQTKVVERLRSIEDTRATQRSLKNKMESFRQDLLDSYFNHETAGKQGSKIKQLDEVCEQIYRYPTFYGLKFGKVGVPVVKISDFAEMDMFQPDLSKYAHIPPSISRKFPKTIMKRDDLVMAVRGTYIGKCVPVPSYLEGANISPNLIRIAPNRSIIRPRFLWHFTCSEWWNEQISSIIHYWKSKFGSVRADQLKKVNVPTPSLEVQDSLLLKLEKSLAITKEMATILRETDELYKSALESSF